MALTLFLLRHAAHLGGQDVLAGAMAGFGLSEPGLDQARRLAGRFADGGFDALYTSPVERCRQTAAIIGEGCRLIPRVEAAAAEIDFGAWSGRTFAELEADPRWRHWNNHRDEGRAPGGEAMREVTRRVAALLLDLRGRHPSGRVILVSHAEIIRTAILQVLGLPLRTYARIEIAPASISTLSLSPQGDRLLCMNDVAHLASGAAPRAPVAA